MSTILQVVLIIFLVVVFYLVVHMSKKPSASSASKSLYNRLGGIYAIAAVVNRFSDRLLSNPVVGVHSPNQFLRDWSLQNSVDAPENTKSRLPGLKWMRIAWLVDVSGGPMHFFSTHGASPATNLTNAHCPLRITEAEFAAVAAELAATLDEFKVPSREKDEVLLAFGKHMQEVTAGSRGDVCARSSIAP